MAAIGRPKIGNEQPQYVRELYYTPFYFCWINLRKRCNQQDSKDYKNYGGRGITYTPRWESFRNFYDDMYSSYALGLQIDRIDNDGNYEPANCRWVTRAENNRNTRANRRFTHNGQSLLLSEWSVVTGVKRSTLAQRIYVYNWPIHKALETKS